MSAPTQAEFFREQFGGEFVLKTFVNTNVDNTFMFKSGDVCIFVKEEYSRIKVQLGSSGDYQESEVGKVRSRSKKLKYSRPLSKNVADINESKREVLEDAFKSSTDLYTAWVNQFGEDSIITDER